MIKYSKGHKYQLEEQTGYETGITGYYIPGDYFALERNGNLTVYKGFAWDGPSGGVDSKNFLRASMIHDVLCLLIASGKLPYDCQDRADQILYDICIESGMWKVRAWWVYKAVRFHFSGNTRPEGREILTAP